MVLAYSGNEERKEKKGGRKKKEKKGGGGGRAPVMYIFFRLVLYLFPVWKS